MNFLNHTRYDQVDTNEWLCSYEQFRAISVVRYRYYWHSAKLLV